MSEGQKGLIGGVVNLLSLRHCPSETVLSETWIFIIKMIFTFILGDIDQGFVVLSTYNGSNAEITVLPKGTSFI